MKLIIDLIEDIRTAINNEKSFSLVAMGLREQNSGELLPSWESGISSMKIDDEHNRLYLFLGKDKPLTTGDILLRLNALPNKKMMHEVLLSYSKENRRVDSSLMGFGESVEEKKYILFVSA